MNEEKKPLSIREQTFVAAILGEAKGDPTQAAKIAGSISTGHTLQTTGSKLLHRPHVQEAIKEQLEEIMSKGEAFGLLAQIARDTGQDRHEQYDQRGQLIGVSFNRTDRIRALDIITKIHGMQKNDSTVEVNVKALVGVDLDRI